MPDSLSGVRVELDAGAVAHADDIARQRHESAVRRGYAGKHGGPTNGIDSLQAHRAGAYGECAVAIFLGVPLPAHVDVYSVPDIEPDIAVRARTKRWHELYRRPSEPADWRYVLVTLTRTRTMRRPVGTVRGWAHGGDMAREEWVQRHGGRPPAWFVPTAALRDPRTLTTHRRGPDV